MNIEELLESARQLQESCDCDGTCKDCKCDLASKPADMETVETKEINVKEPELDTKELLKKLEDFNLDVLDVIKKQDPEAGWEMIDGKTSLDESEVDLIPEAEKVERAEEIKKTWAKRSTRPVEEDLNKEIKAAGGKEVKGKEPEVDCEKEVNKAVEEPKKVEVEDVVEIKESAEDTVVAKYETVDGKHEIIRTAEGLYKNRYFLKEDGKARRTTRGVKTLPTAVGALMRRFPEAQEIKD